MEDNKKLWRYEGAVFIRRFVHTLGGASNCRLSPFIKTIESLFIVKAIAAKLQLAAITIYKVFLPHLQKSHQEGIREDELLFTEGELDVNELVGFAYDYACAKLWMQYAAVHIERSQLGS